MKPIKSEQIKSEQIKLEETKLDQISYICICNKHVVI